MCAASRWQRAALSARRVGTAAQKATSPAQPARSSATAHGAGRTRRARGAHLFASSSAATAATVPPMAGTPSVNSAAL
ncbi:MAG: hypothetical protein ACYS1C_04255 [Planctomycetota bacterium]